MYSVFIDYDGVDMMSAVADAVNASVEDGLTPASVIVWKTSEKHYHVELRFEDDTDIDDVSIVSKCTLADPNYVELVKIHRHSFGRVSSAMKDLKKKKRPVKIAILTREGLKNAGFV